MRKNKKAVFACAALAVLVIALAGLFIYIRSEPDFSLSPEKVVRLTEKGFVPARLVVQQGDTVTFENDLQREAWPASSPHPTHDIYPAFDPRQPVPPGASWSFTFQLPGVWLYHDHLASDLEGQVVVLNAKGDFVNTACENKDLPTVQCFQNKVLSALDTGGLDAALDEMSTLYESEPAFKDSCHSIAHSLGKEAYHLFEKGKKINLTGKTSYCSYGFYHGFMEEMLQISGDFEQARAFCAEAGKTLATESQNAEGACYHGIGHGTVDGSDPRMWGDAEALVTPGIVMCDKVDPTEPHFYRCLSGAFNALAIIYINNEYGLTLPTADPFAVCSNWKEFRIANPCYQEMNTVLMKVTGGSLSKTIGLVEKISDLQYAKLAMTSAAGVIPSYFASPSAENFTKAINDCHAADKDLVISCINGIPSGIMEFGTPGKEYMAAIEFCSSKLLTEDERDNCMRVVFGGVRAYYPPEKQAAICATVEEKYRENCIRP